MRRSTIVKLSLTSWLGLVLSFQNCMESQAKDGSASQSSSAAGSTPATDGSTGAQPIQPASADPQSPAMAALFAIAADPAVSINLGAQQMNQISVTPLAAFGGGVDLSVDITALKMSDPAQTMRIALSQSHVNLTGAQGVKVPLQIASAVESPTLNTVVDIIATESSPPPSRAPFQLRLHVPVKVVAVYEVTISGGAAKAETWSSPKSLSFATHPEGVTMRFVNNGTVAHRVHSSGPIPHEPMDLPVGGKYEFVVKGQVKATNTYYCHDHESAGTSARTIIFNASSAAPAFTKSGNPNATYTYLASNILPKCTGCHGANAPAKGLDLSSYASVTSSVASVIAGSPASSGLYVETANKSMPLGGTPLSAADLKNIQDWISDGAINK